MPDCVKSWSRKEPVELRNPNSTRPWQHVLEPLSGYLTLASRLSQFSSIHGESYNFGPPAHQNQSVGELVDKMGDYWEEATWIDVSDQYEGPPESGLLKLNCDKALHELDWLATWGFEETVRETALWYKEYYSGDRGAILEKTLSQIKTFSDDAVDRGIKWAK